MNANEVMCVKLMTKEIEKRFAEVGRQEGKGYDALVIAKYFFPAGSATWWATAYDPKDRCFFGYVTGMAENEWGDFSLDELQRTRARGFGIERDLYFREQPLREALRKVGVEVRE